MVFGCLLSEPVVGKGHRVAQTEKQPESEYMQPGELAPAGGKLHFPKRVRFLV